MKENRILFFLFIALLVVAFFALQAFNKWKKITEEFPLLREEQRRFVLTEGKITEAAKKELGLFYTFDEKNRVLNEWVHDGQNYAQIARQSVEGRKNLERIKNNFWNQVFSDNREFQIKRIDFLKKSPGYNGILFSSGTLDKWLKENQ